MKRMKKFFALVLSAAMLLSLFATASMAVTTSDGSITIENATVGETYAVYKVFDLTYSATDSSKVSYTLDKSENAALYDAIKADTDSPFTLTATNSANIFDVSLKAGETASTVTTWLTAHKTALGTGTSTKATGSSLVFSGLPYGYYYIVSSLESVVTINSAKPSVTVVDKNQVPTWDNNPNPPADDPFAPGPGKVIVNADGTKVTENSVNIGDTVNFSIAVNATAFVGDDLVTYYYITDTLGAGFGAASNIKVSVAGAELAATDYSIRKSGDGHSFQVTVPFGEKYGSNAKIEVTYSAVLQDDAVIGTVGNLNTANFTYATDSTYDPNDPTPPYDPSKPGDPTNPNYPDDPYEPTNPTDPYVPTDPEHPDDPDDPRNPPYVPDNKKETTTYTYAIGVYKIDGVTGAALTGAGFTLDANIVTPVLDETGAPVKNDDGTAKTTTTLASVYAVKNSDGVYTVCAAGTTDAETTFMVNDAGQLTIKGLAEGSYTVTETVRPDGYNAIDPKTANVSKTTATATEITTTVDKPTTVSYDVQVYGMEIKNFTGAELPTTGGIGTTIFYAAGAILVLGAGVLMITKKRMA